MIDVFGFRDERMQFPVGLIERLRIESCDLLEHGRQPFVQRLDLAAPRRQCRFLAIADRLCGGRGAVAQHTDPRAQISHSGVFVFAVCLSELVDFVS